MGFKFPKISVPPRSWTTRKTKQGDESLLGLHKRVNIQPDEEDVPVSPDVQRMREERAKKWRLPTPLSHPMVVPDRFIEQDAKDKGFIPHYMLPFSGQSRYDALPAQKAAYEAIMNLPREIPGQEEELPPGVARLEGPDISKPSYIGDFVDPIPKAVVGVGAFPDVPLIENPPMRPTEKGQKYLEGRVAQHLHETGETLQPEDFMPASGRGTAIWMLPGLFEVDAPYAEPQTVHLASGPLTVGGDYEWENVWEMFLGLEPLTMNAKQFANFFAWMENQGMKPPVYGNAIAAGVGGLAKIVEYIGKSFNLVGRSYNVLGQLLTLDKAGILEAEAAVLERSLELSDIADEAGERFSDALRHAHDSWLARQTRATSSVEQAKAGMSIDEMKAAMSQFVAEEDREAWKFAISSWWNQTPEWRNSRHGRWTFNENQEAYENYQNDIYQVYVQTGEPVTYAVQKAVAERHEDLLTEIAGDIVVDWLNVPGVSHVFGAGAKLVWRGGKAAVKGTAKAAYGGGRKGLATIVKGTLPTVSKHTAAIQVKNAYSDVAMMLMAQTGEANLTDAFVLYRRNPLNYALSHEQHVLIRKIGDQIFKAEWTDEAGKYVEDYMGLAGHADDVVKGDEMAEFFAEAVIPENRQFLHDKLIADRWANRIADEALRVNGVPVNGYFWEKVGGKFVQKVPNKRRSDLVAAANKGMAYWVESVLLTRPAFYIRNYIDSSGRLMLEAGGMNVSLVDALRGFVPDSIFTGYAKDLIRGGAGRVVSTGKVVPFFDHLKDAVRAMASYTQGGSPFADFPKWFGGRGGGKKHLWQWQREMAEAVVKPTIKPVEQTHGTRFMQQFFENIQAVGAAFATGVIPNIFETLSRASGGGETFLRLIGNRRIYIKKMHFLNRKYFHQVFKQLPMFRDNDKLLGELWGIWHTASDSPAQLVRLAQDLVKGKRNVVWSPVYEYLQQAGVRADDIEGFVITTAERMARDLTPEMTLEEMQAVFRSAILDMQKLVDDTSSHFREVISEGAAARIDESIDVIVDDVKVGDANWRTTVGEPVPTRRPGVKTVNVREGRADWEIVDDIEFGREMRRTQEGLEFVASMRLDVMRQRLLQFFREVVPGPYGQVALDKISFAVTHEQYRILAGRIKRALASLYGEAANFVEGGGTIEDFMNEVTSERILKIAGAEVTSDGTIVFRNIMTEHNSVEALVRAGHDLSNDVIAAADTFIIQGEDATALFEGYEAFIKGRSVHRRGIGYLDDAVGATDDLGGKRFILGDKTLNNYEAALGGVRVTDFIVTEVSPLIHKGNFHQKWLERINELSIGYWDGIADFPGRYNMNDRIPAWLAEEAWDSLGVDFIPEIPISRFAVPLDGLSPGVMQTQLYADNIRGAYTGALEHWSDFLMQLDEVPVTTDEWAAEFLGWVQTAGREHKSYLAQAAQLGAEKAGHHPVLDGVVKGLGGAADQITRAMVNYAQRHAVEGGMRWIFPFWTFPTRSLPWWIGYLSTHPNFIKYYHHFQKASRLQAYNYNAVSQSGRPLRRLWGHLPVPAIVEKALNLPEGEYWFAPLKAFSFEAVLGVEPVDYKQIEEIGPLQKMIQFWMTYGPAVGLYPGPWIIPILMGAGMSSDTVNSHPQRGIIGIFDLLGPAVKHQIIDMVNKTNILHRLVPDDWAPFIWSAEVPWTNYIVTRRVIGLTAEAAEFTHTPEERLALSDAMHNAIQFANVLQTIEDDKGERITQEDYEIALEQAREEWPEGAKLWEQARQEIWDENAVARNLSWNIGFSVKRFASSEAEVARIVQYDSMLADHTADNLGIEEEYREWLHETLEGKIAKAYRTISWVVDDEGNRVYKEAWMEEVVGRMAHSSHLSQYWEKYGQIWEARETELAHLPIGTPYEERAAIYEHWDGVLRLLDEAFPDARGEWSPYNKHMETLKERILHDFVRQVEHQEPGWQPDEETWDEYQLRLVGWRNEHSDTAANTVRVNMLADYANNEIMSNAIEEFGAGGMMLMGYSSVEARDAYHRQYDDELDALERVWAENYRNVYWERLEALQGYTRSFEEATFLNEFEGLERPTNQQLTDWVMEEYPERFDEGTLMQILNDNSVLTIQDRMEYGKDEWWYEADKIWDILTRVGPNRRKLTDKMSFVHAGSLDNTWWDSGGDLVNGWYNEERRREFMAEVHSAAAELEAEGELPELTIELHEQFKIAYEAYQEYKKHRNDKFRVPEGEPFDTTDFTSQDWEQFKRLRFGFAADNPVWAQYFLSESEKANWGYK